MNIFGVASFIKNTAMAAQARIVYDRANARLAGEQREAREAIGEARSKVAHAAALDPRPVLTVEQVRQRMRQRI